MQLAKSEVIAYVQGEDKLRKLVGNLPQREEEEEEEEEDSEVKEDGNEGPSEDERRNFQKG